MTYIYITEDMTLDGKSGARALKKNVIRVELLSCTSHMVALGLAVDICICCHLLCFDYYTILWLIIVFTVDFALSQVVISLKICSSFLYRD